MAKQAALAVLAKGPKVYLELQWRLLVDHGVCLDLEALDRLIKSMLKDKHIFLNDVVGKVVKDITITKAGREALKQ